MKLQTFLFICICVIGSIFNAMFFSLNDVLKIADSFAYLQMSHFLQELSQEGLGSGWFGFLYSLPIAFIDFFLKNDFLSAKITNLILWNITAILLWTLSLKILSKNFSLVVIALYFLSGSLIPFHIHVLSENIYIPLFLWFFLSLYNFIIEREMISSPSLGVQRERKQIIILGVILGLLYLTRAEGFIYIISVGILAFGMLIKKILSFKRFIQLGSLFFLSFFLCISPYLWHLHDVTGTWGLTNKGASNLRQAELRGTQHMDDAGFEQAVAELTADKQHLIAGFAGGMRYDTPQIEGSFQESFLKDPWVTIHRITENQKKLFLQNIPEIFLGDSFKLYNSQDARFGKNPLYLLFLLVPFFVGIFGFWKLFRKEKVFLYTTLALFLPACIFFTLFFTLNRYFIVFLPLLLIIFVYGISSLFTSSRILSLILLGNIVCIFLLSSLVYWNTESPKDQYYTLKQEAGIWLKDHLQKIDGQDIDILERFPIVTYYSGIKTRFITPYTDSPADIRSYAVYNGVELLVVDSMDFLTYRPQLASLLEETPVGFSKLKEFSNPQGQKVILYKVKK